MSTPKPGAEKPKLNWFERLTGYKREGDETRWHMHVTNTNEHGGPWWLTAQWMFHPTVRGYYLGPLAKGWWTLGPKHTSEYAEVGLALGGEDSMLQVELQVPKLFTWRAGVRVPHRWINPVVYERRTLSIRPGYIGDLAWVDVLYDETAKDMRSYYAEQRGPYGGRCANCKMPGYCHQFTPTRGEGVQAWEFRYFDRLDDTGTTWRPRRVDVVVGTHERALGEVERLLGMGYSVRMAETEWPTDAVCWTAIGTDLVHTVDCPGWEKAESHEPPRASLWPGWQIKLDPRLRDRLLGKTDYAHKNITHEVEPRQPVRYLKAGHEMVLGIPAVVAMPEGNYPCVVRFFEDTWKRPRLPWNSRMIRRAEVSMVVPVPTPGKGENSWDIDDDAIFAQSAPGTSVAAATAGVAASAMRDRERYSKRDWKPASGWPVGVHTRGDGGEH